MILINESQCGTARVKLALPMGRDYRATQFWVPAGSAQIQEVPITSATAAVERPPLSLALVRLEQA